MDVVEIKSSMSSLLAQMSSFMQSMGSTPNLPPQPSAPALPLIPELSSQERGQFVVPSPVPQDSVLVFRVLWSVLLPLWLRLFMAYTSSFPSGLS